MSLKRAAWVEARQKITALLSSEQPILRDNHEKRLLSGHPECNDATESRRFSWYIFQPKKRIGVAIGSQILDLSKIKHLFDGPELKDRFPMAWIAGARLFQGKRGIRARKAQTPTEPVQHPATHPPGLCMIRV